MFRFGFIRWIQCAFFALSLMATALQAQSITITPSYPGVVVGASVPLTAKLTGLSGGIAWAVNKVAGGNNTVGTIVATGPLTATYTAPAIVPNQVLVTATSTTKSSIVGADYINVLTVGPAITSVTPNPLFTGNISVTIQGSGFMTGAKVLQHNTSGDAAMTTTSVTPAAITATGYQGSTGAVSFSVENPGSAPGNSISVPVTTAYKLTVANGTGGGTYPANTVVTIAAAAAPAGQAFTKWTGATVASATSPTTTLKMPASNATVTANFAKLYTLTVVNGTGSGSYLAKTSVAINANAPPTGDVFLDWTGATVASASSASTTLTMPSASTTVTANYTPQQTGPASCANLSLGNNASLNGFVPFPSTTAWNTDISAAPLDPNNTAITSASGFAGLHLHHDFSSTNGGNYGIPYVVVDSGTTPLTPISVTDYASESDVAAAPYPTTAPIEGSPADCYGWPNTYVGDSHVLVLDRKACMLYETFNTHRCNGAWSASSETIWDMKNYDRRPYGWTSADAAGLPIFPGLIRYDEVAAGAIDHAIRFTMKVTKNDANGGYFVAPATHAAGVYYGVENVMGMRIRLKSSFDISKYSAANQVILTAMKKYGMILADNGGYFFFQGVPDPRWNDADLVNLDQIASSNFEVVQMTPTYPGWDSATAPTGQPPVINSFAASPATVPAGTPVTLTWSTTNDSYDFIDKLGGVRGGAVTLTPAATTTYTLNATNQYGRSTRQVTVTVK